MFDYHMHSDFSADCDTPMENTIEKAIELGLKEICFTDHIDYDYPDKDWVFEFDMSAYDRKIRAVQEKYADRITIKKGVEIGLQPHLLKRYEKLVKENKFDFIICSLHTAENKDLHSGDFFTGKTIDEAFEGYYRELLQCIKGYKSFSVLGHLDLIKRYAKEKSKNDFHEVIEEIFKEIIPAGKGIEVNTSGVKSGLGTMPSRDILELYKTSGGEIVTLGSDSHIPEMLAGGFSEVLETLQDIGFKYVATFTNGKPEFHPISGLR
jgi:histidinol-phosphatase (PHP family)